jgi:pimeloyl-ACP methyl ester carboxylesterase
VLLHGFLGSGKNLGVLARGWGARDPDRRFLLPDLLGHGRSPPLPEGASLADMARATLALIEAHALPTPVDVVGHSMGGRVALEARRLGPDRVGRIGLLDIQPGRIERSDTERVVDILVRAPARAASRDEMRARLVGEGLSRPIADWLLMSGDADEEGFAWRIDRPALERFHREMRGQDLWPAVEATEALTVSIRGAESAYVDEADQARIRAAGGITRTIEGAGHFLHVDRTDAVVAALDETLPRAA